MVHLKSGFIQSNLKNNLPALCPTWKLIFSPWKNKKITRKHSFSFLLPAQYPSHCHFSPELVQFNDTLPTLLQTVVLPKENQIKYLLFLKFLICFLLQLKKNLTPCHVAAKPMFLLTPPTLKLHYQHLQIFQPPFKTPASKAPVGLFLLSRLFCFLLVLVICCFFLF